MARPDRLACEWAHSDNTLPFRRRGDLKVVRPPLMPVTLERLQSNGTTLVKSGPSCTAGAQGALLQLHPAEVQ
jgi:hypothetical protein